MTGTLKEQSTTTIIRRSPQTAVMDIEELINPQTDDLITNKGNQNEPRIITNDVVKPEILKIEDSEDDEEPEESPIMKDSFPHTVFSDGNDSDDYNKVKVPSDESTVDEDTIQSYGDSQKSESRSDSFDYPYYDHDEEEKIKDDGTDSDVQLVFHDDSDCEGNSDINDVSDDVQEESRGIEYKFVKVSEPVADESYNYVDNEIDDSNILDTYNFSDSSEENKDDYHFEPYSYEKSFEYERSDGVCSKDKIEENTSRLFVSESSDSDCDCDFEEEVQEEVQEEDQLDETLQIDEDGVDSIYYNPRKRLIADLIDDLEETIESDQKRQHCGINNRIEPNSTLKRTLITGSIGALVGSAVTFFGLVFAGSD